ncbi:Arrestin (or S-antigen), N-terminal domain [Seminavis robusta]|uniref:Arrestin (Or S-antigen), N-terminal domain n=1 Tax=Seminavis robusta TaxID=568900 RepID=A0A9N8E1Z3_9STRA|nr:Arrestin (or S-antigen), N-terminal domain [Seminavis robusta]|eukprot:Sro537_g162280.1 Arrestin (or S-antigen), N-terminal domain (617) ;mRNA; r:8378-10228
MGNTPIQIGLKIDKQTYQHGETMTGTVYVSVSSVTPAIQSYQGIRLAFGGSENTEIRIRESHGSGSDRHTSIRTERESTSLLHVEVPLTSFASPLRVAKYEFPFEWKLPDTPLPSSFRHRNAGVDGKGFCEIRYSLSAFLVPQEQQMGFFGPRRNSNTCASQTIQFVGAPTREIPEPLHLAEERTHMNGLCCCWKQGHVSLGWEADSIVLTPEAPCQIQIWGSNASAIPVHGLRVQLIQSVQWQAGQEFHRRRSWGENSSLVDFNVDVSHLPQWDHVTHKGHGSSYSAVNNQHGAQPVSTSFQVPPDVLDSYQGLNCKVEHKLIVSAVTRFMATTPAVSYSVHLQRSGTTSSSPASMPVAMAWMEESEFQDVALPTDWSPDETVPVIHLTEINALEDEAGDNASKVTMATAEAVMVEPVGAAAATTSFGRSDNPLDGEDPLAFARPADDLAPSAPMEDEFLMDDAAADLQQVLGMLRQIDPNDLTSHRRIEHQIRNLPVSQRVLQTLSPPQYRYLCEAGTNQTLSRIAFLLATELNKRSRPGFRGEYLVALMQLPLAKDGSISLIGSLTDQICDLPQSHLFVEQSLEPQDAQWFRQRVNAILPAVSAAQGMSKSLF